MTDYISCTMVSSSIRFARVKCRDFFKQDLTDLTRRSHQPPYQGEAGVMNFQSGALLPKTLVICLWHFSKVRALLL